MGRAVLLQQGRPGYSWSVYFLLFFKNTQVEKKGGLFQYFCFPLSDTHEA